MVSYFPSCHFSLPLLCRLSFTEWPHLQLHPSFPQPCNIIRCFPRGDIPSCIHFFFITQNIFFLNFASIFSSFYLITMMKIRCVPFNNLKFLLTFIIVCFFIPQHMRSSSHSAHVHNIPSLVMGSDYSSFVFSSMYLHCIRFPVFFHYSFI